MNTDHNKENLLSEAMNNVCNVSAVLLGVCLTVISLFQIMDKRATYIIDEIFGVLSFLFALSILLSYLSVKKNMGTLLKKNNRLRVLIFFDPHAPCRNIAYYGNITPLKKVPSYKM